MRSWLIFVKPNSRGANKSSVAAAERPSFVSSFSFPLFDSSPTALLLRRLFQPPATNADFPLGTIEAPQRFSISIPRFSFDLNEKNRRREIREAGYLRVRCSFEKTEGYSHRRTLTRQTGLPPCHSLLSGVFSARFTSPNRSNQALSRLGDANEMIVYLL